MASLVESDDACAETMANDQRRRRAEGLPL